MMKNTLIKTGKQQGMTLLEVLIALIVLSIGLLSIASLQLRSVQFSHASYERSMAVISANDMVERLWAGACALYEGDPDERIETDEWQAVTLAWQQDNAGSIQGWTGAVERNDARPELFEVSIQWRDRIDDTQHQFTYLTRVPDLGLECE